MTIWLLVLWIASLMTIGPLMALKFDFTPEVLDSVMVDGVAARPRIMVAPNNGLAKVSSVTPLTVLPLIVKNWLLVGLLIGPANVRLLVVSLALLLIMLKTTLPAKPVSTIAL